MVDSTAQHWQLPSLKRFSSHQLDSAIRYMEMGKTIDYLELDTQWTVRQVPTTSELITAMAKCPRINVLQIVEIPLHLLIPLLQSLISVAKPLRRLYVDLQNP